MLNSNEFTNKQKLLLIVFKFPKKRSIQKQNEWKNDISASRCAESINVTNNSNDLMCIESDAHLAIDIIHFLSSTSLTMVFTIS